MSSRPELSPPPAQKSRSTQDPLTKVPGDVSRKLISFLGDTDRIKLSVTSTRQHEDYIETQKSLYVKYITHDEKDYATAVRKITSSLREDEAIKPTFVTFILLPFTQEVNGRKLSEAEEICQYLLWLVRYKVHPVHVAYGLYVSKNYDEFETVCTVFNDPRFAAQFQLAVALMNENAQEVLARCYDSFVRNADYIILFLDNCTEHKQLYENRRVHHINLALQPQTCICYGKNTVWFKDVENNYLSRVTIDENDTIIPSARDVELLPFFDVQRPDKSIAEIEQVPCYKANTSDSIVQYTQVLKPGNDSRIVNCARYTSEIVIVLTEDGDIYAHGGGQQQHILQTENPFVNLLYDYSKQTITGTRGVLTELAVFALSARGIVYWIYVNLFRHSLDFSGERPPTHKQLKINCIKLACHPFVTQLAVLQTPRESEIGSWGQITLHPEGSLYAHFEESNFELASNVTLIPHVIHDAWNHTDPCFFVVCKGVAANTSQLKRVTLKFATNGTQISWINLHRVDDHRTVTITATTEFITLKAKIPIVDKLNIDCIIEMVQDFDGNLYCLTSTGIVYKCQFNGNGECQSNIVELPEDDIIKTFKTPSSEAVDTASDSDIDMGASFLRLRLRL